MQGYQIYATASINDCPLIQLHANAHAVRCRPAMASRSKYAVPHSPGHAMYLPISIHIVVTGSSSN
ncbi:hypothetical protein KDI_43130 [Dictyobacter arantiisoli]|uniref:Uncharacterized protein n=1 Tax=Dictyobacter arantiisoli TaxID=2014874 RepID=A0A5A5TIB3_9CHLR|nr:hypothetical protein KDI_43130 [Dictyobacter arantiisoli]